jgi:argonaute-like protein implicated in RNA metabolism and viral defense
MAHRQEHIKKMELKKQARLAAGVMSDRFPKVSGIVINMTYFHKAENPVLMERMVNFFPTSNAYFNMECMIKGCEEGGFDLTRIVKKQIKDNKKILKGKMVCKGKNGESSSEHSSITYEINVKYNRKRSK